MITELRRLWKQAFGDTDAFLDDFFATGYSPERCHYLLQDGQLAAALYWFDCQLKDRKMAYVYAVATDEAFRNRGLCRRLLDETHGRLRSLGYSGALLVPGSQSLFRLYEKLGYRTCSYIAEVTCPAGTPVEMHAISADEYARLRQKHLSANSVLQEGVTLDFLSRFADFYAGDGFVLAASLEGQTAYVQELLGTADTAGVVSALGAIQGRVRTPGQETPFAMYYALDAGPAPAYFGLALD